MCEAPDEPETEVAMLPVAEPVTRLAEPETIVASVAIAPPTTLVVDEPTLTTNDEVFPRWKVYSPGERPAGI